MDIDELLEMVGHHIFTDFKVSLRAKGIQVIKTTSTQMLMGLSIKMGPEVVKSVTDKVLKLIEGETDKPWINFCVYMGWPGGMPFIERKARQQLDDMDDRPSCTR